MVFNQAIKHDENTALLQSCGYEDRYIGGFDGWLRG